MSTSLPGSSLPARALARFATALLRATPPTPLTALSPEQLVEQHDVDGALLLAWQRTLPRRIDDAKAKDAVAVIVADGSAYDVATAEKQLAQKEETRVYAPLRAALVKAQAPFQRFGDRRNEWRRALVLPEPAPPAERVKLLSDFLASSNGELEAARDVLGSVGGVDLDDSAAYARGVDLPDPSLFSDLHAAALIKQALGALPRGARPVLRVPAPRALAGVVVDDDDAVRLWSAPCLSAGRFLALTQGAARALACAASVDGHVDAHAGAIGLALVDADVRRAVLDDSKANAAKAARVVAATAFLAARAKAAAALVVVKGYGDVDEEREVARDAVRAAVGVDVGDIPAAALLLPPLPGFGPGGRVVGGAATALVDDAVACASAAAAYVFVRDQLDAAFLLRPRVLEALRELPPSSADAARGWAGLFAELL